MQLSSFNRTTEKNLLIIVLSDFFISIHFYFQTLRRHGRVAMFAFVGYIVHANGIKFPWAMQMDGASFPTGTNPPELWDQVGDAAKWQIFGLIFFLEAWSEIGTADHPHYMRGGKPGDMPDFDGVDEMKLPHPVPFNYFDPFGKNSEKILVC